MKNKMKGQQNIRRPLPIRIMALVMAVVMIFSVVYINNRYGVVKADPVDAGTSITDGNFITKERLKDAGFIPDMSDGTTEGTLTVYAAYDSNLKNTIDFTLPVYDEVVATSPDGAYVLSEKVTIAGVEYDQGSYFLQIPSGVASEDADKFQSANLYRTSDYAWMGDNGTVTSIKSGENASLVRYNLYTVKIGEAYESVEVKDFPVAKKTIGQLTVNNESLCAIKITSASSGITAEEDNTSGGTRNEAIRTGGAVSQNVAYYGSLDYEVTNDTTLYSSLASFASAYSGDGKADGPYTLTKKIVTVIDGNKVVLAQNTTDFVKDTMPINSITATYNKNGEKTVSYTSSLDEITISGINNKYPVNIVVNTDYSYGESESAGDYKIATTGEGNITYVVDGKNINIQAESLVKSSNLNIILEVYNKKGDTTPIKTVKIHLTCGDGTPTVTNPAIAPSDPSYPTVTIGTGENAKTYYNNKNVTVSASASVVSGSGAYISAANVYKNGVEGYPYEPTATKSYTEEDAASTISVDTELTDEGINTFRIGATSSFEDTVRNETDLVAYLDTTAPIVESVSLNQKISSTETYSATSAETASPYSFGDTKITKNKPASITLRVSDSGCGLADKPVYCGETELTDNGDGTYTYTIPANSSDVSFGFTIKDKLDNASIITVNVVYFDDDIKITDRKIVDADSVEYQLITGDFIKWEGDKVTDTTQRTYKLVYSGTYSEGCPISSAILSYKNNGAATTTSDTVPPTEIIKYDNGTFIISTDYYNSPNNSHSKSEIVLSVTNKHGVTVSDTLEVLNIVVDGAAPTLEGPKENDSTGSAPSNTAWYKDSLLLWFKATDPADYSSGLVNVESLNSGATVSSMVNGEFTATVAESTPKTKTEPALPTVVELKITDNAGNEKLYNGETTSNTNSFFVDATAPTTGLVVETSNKTASYDSTTYFDSEPTIYYKADDTLSGIDQVTEAKIKLGSTEKKITEGVTHPLSDFFTEDSYTDSDEFVVTITVKDKVGHETTDTVTFKVDKNGPDVKGEKKTTAAKSSYPNHYNKNVEFEVVVTDKNITQSGLKLTDTNESPATITWTPNADNTVWTGKVIASSEGGHNITITATDNSTLSNSWSSGNFTIDKTPPAITTLLNGSEYTKDNSYNKTVTTGISYSDDNKDDNDVTAIIVRDIPGGGQTTSTKKGLGPHSISEDGKYTVTYKVVDKAGNLTTTNPIGFTVDNTAPVHNLYVTTANPSKVEDYPNNYINGVGKWQSSHEAYRYGQFYNGDVTVELNYFDYNLDWVYVTDNGEEISPSWTKSGAFGKATYTFTSEGYHDVQIWSKDLSGNETNDTVLGKRVRFTIDRSAPSITTYLNSSLYSEGSGTRYLNTNGSLNVSVSEGNKDTYDLTRYYKMTPPGGTAKTGEDKVDEGTENYSEEADYEVSYVAVDKAGNKSATRNVYFRVDRTAPKLTINGPGSSSNASSTSVSFNVQESFYWDMTSCTVKIYKKVDGSGEVLEKTLDMNPTSANYSQSYSFVDDAEYRMEFTAEDKCGNKSQTDYTFIKDGNAPSILLSGVKNYDKTDKNVELTVTIEEAFYTSNRVTLSGTRTDIDGKSHKIDFDDFATNRTKISQLQQMFKEDGIYDITVTSTDKAGNSSSKTVHFTIDTTDPVIGDLSKYDGVKLNNFKWDVDLDKLVKDLTVCDIKVYLDGALYDGTSDIEDGSHVLKVEATDELGHSSSKEVTFVLDSKAPNIIVMNVEEGDNLLESTDITVTVELDEDSLDTVTLNDKTIDIANNEGKITVNEKGDYVLNATAHDEAGNVSSVEIKFSYGKQTNLLFIGIIAGAAILLLLLLLVFLRRRRNEN